MRLKTTLATNQDGLMNVTLYLFHSSLSKGRFKDHYLFQMTSYCLKDYMDLGVILILK